jgi:ABC-2 type transport system permease protein
MDLKHIRILLVSVLRGVLLKGARLADTWPHLCPIGVFLLTMGALALVQYRETVD